MNAKLPTALGAIVFALGQIAYGQYAIRPAAPTAPIYANPYAHSYLFPPSWPPAVRSAGYIADVQAPAAAAAQARSRHSKRVATGSQQRIRTADQLAVRVFPGHKPNGDRDGHVAQASVLMQAPEPIPLDDSASELQRPEGKGKSREGYAWRVFGEYLLLRPRDAEVAYAVESNLNAPPVIPPIQTSPIAILDPDTSSGYRVGFGASLDPCSELTIAYTAFDATTTDSITRTLAGRQIEPMVIHPSTRSGITGTVAASGRHGIEFDLIDVDYRRDWRRTCDSRLTWLVGVRWGQLEQTTSARFTDDLQQPTNETDVATDIDFSGAGVRFGLEGERYFCRLPVLVYLKTDANLLAGEFDATYQQTVQNASNLGVNTGWQAGRIVPTFDLELGGGIYLHDGLLQFRVGYVYSVWTNIVKTDDFIHAVQTNDFRDMNDSMTFDGLVVRVEGRF